MWRRSQKKRVVMMLKRKMKLININKKKISQGLALRFLAKKAL